MELCPYADKVIKYEPFGPERDDREEHFRPSSCRRILYTECRRTSLILPPIYLYLQVAQAIAYIGRKTIGRQLLSACRLIVAEKATPNSAAALNWATLGPPDIMFPCVLRCRKRMNARKVTMTKGGSLPRCDFTALANDRIFRAHDISVR